MKRPKRYDTEQWTLRLILTAAFLLSLFGITHGFPLHMLGDEPTWIKTALRLPMSNFDPHLYFHPILPFLFLLIPAGITYLISGIVSLNMSPQHFIALFFEKPYWVFFSCRLATAALLGIIIYIFYRALKERISEPFLRLGITAVFAFNPVIIGIHHVGNTDSIALLMSCAAVGFFLSMASRVTLKEAALSGLCCGLLLSSKFNTVVFLTLFLFYFLLTWKQQEHPVRNLFMFGTSTVLVFMLLNPYLFLHFNAAFREISRQNDVLILAGVQDTGQLIFETFRAFFCDLSPVILLFIILAIPWALRQYRKDPKIFSLAVFSIVTFLFIFLHRHVFMRYYFPLFASTYLIIGCYLQTLLPRLKTLFRKVLWGTLLFVIVWSLGLSFFNGLPLLQVTPETKAYEWIISTVPSHSSILTNYHALFIPETADDLKKRMDLARENDTYKYDYYRILYDIAAAPGDKKSRYHVKFIYDLAQVGLTAPKRKEFLGSEDAMEFADLSRAPQLLGRYDYVVLEMNSADRSVIAALSHRLKLMQTYDRIRIYAVIK